MFDCQSVLLLANLLNRGSSKWQCSLWASAIEAVSLPFYLSRTLLSSAESNCISQYSFLLVIIKLLLLQPCNHVVNHLDVLVKVHFLATDCRHNDIKSLPISLASRLGLFQHIRCLGLDRKGALCQLYETCTSWKCLL